MPLPLAFACFPSRVVCKQDGRTALSFAAKGAFERALAAGQDVDRRFEAILDEKQFHFTVGVVDNQPSVS